MSKNGSLVKNAAVISVGGFIAKLLGAFYRIPLTNLLGSRGLGLYQMVFPVYCILLDFAGAGLPCGLSKLVSEREARGDDGRELLKTALILMSAAGLIATALMSALALPLARLQGDAAAYKSYIALSPAVFFVALISCYRGYFQGKQNMLPTAISQVAEQVIKLGAGLLLVWLIMPDVASAAAGAAAAVSISEAAALLLLYLMFMKKEKQHLSAFPLSRERIKACSGSIFKICLPVTLTSVLLPVSQTADSFLIINLIGRYSESATSLYGLLSGGVMAIIGVPVAICYGIAVSALPMIARGEQNANKNLRRALSLTAVLSFIMGCGIFALASPAVKLLFFGLSAAEKTVSIKLLRLMSPSVLLLSLVQTANSVLVGKNRPYAPIIGLGLGIAVKTVLEVILLSRPELNIYAAAISANVCYLVAVIVDLLYIIRVCGSGKLPKLQRGQDENKKLTPRKYSGNNS